MSSMRQQSQAGFDIDNLCADDTLAQGCDSPRTLEFAQTQSREVTTVGDYTNYTMEEEEESLASNSMTQGEWTIEKNWTLDNNFSKEEVNKVLGKNHHYRPVFDAELTGTVNEHIHNQVDSQPRTQEHLIYNPKSMWWKASIKAWLPSRNWEVLAFLVVYNLCVVMVTAFSDICGDPDTYGLGAFCNEDWFLFNGGSLNMLGIAIFVLLAFRINMSVNRYQECCRQWEKLESACRNLTRQICFHVSIDNDKESWERRRAVAFAASVPIAVKLKLRGETNALPGLGNILVQQDVLNVMKARNMPQFCVDNISYYLMSATKVSRFTDERLAAAESTGLGPMVEAMTSLEKLNTIPAPISYVFQLRLFILIWLVLYPLHLVSYHGLFTIFLAFFIDYVVLGLESLAADFDTPFGYEKNALDLDSLCKELQRDLDEILVRSEHESRELIFNTWEVSRKNEEMIYKASSVELEMLTVKRKVGKQGRAQFVRNATGNLHNSAPDNASQTDFSATSAKSEA